MYSILLILKINKILLILYKYKNNYLNCKNFYKNLMLITLIYFIFFLFFNIKFYNLFFIKIYNYCNFFGFTNTIDVISLFMLFYNIFISYICIYYIINKIYINNLYTLVFLLLILFFIFILFTTNSIYIFFLSYEFILLPSVFLVYISSPNLRAKIISFYFLFWTQFGSFLFFIVIIILFNNNINFNYNNGCINHYYKYIIIILLFIGFGIKIPIWPFHFWLTKTHVEVNTSFSIFLSGILVKIAIYGFYKFFFLFSNYNNIFFLIIIMVGILDITIKLLSQTDFKKIIAYCTIFEMNIILFNIFFFNFNIIIYIVLFCILHTTLSCIFFLINDFIYKRYNTRCVLSIGGLINNCNNFSILLLVSVILFNGIPFTLKFNLEFSIFLKLSNFDIILFLVFSITQIIFIIFFTKIVYSIIFNNSSYSKIVDISLNEVFLILINFIVLLLI